MLLPLGNQAEAVRVLRDTLDYLHRTGGTEAAFIIASKIREIMPFERPELRRK